MSPAYSLVPEPITKLLSLLEDVGLFAGAQMLLTVFDVGEAESPKAILAVAVSSHQGPMVAVEHAARPM